MSLAIQSRCTTVCILLFHHWVTSESLRTHGLQHDRVPCPSLSPEVCSNSCPSSWWCCPTISSSVTPFSSCLQSFPESGSFPLSQFFISASQSIGASASASVLPMNIQGWFTHNETPFSLSCLAPSSPSQLEALTPSAYAVTCGPRINPADSRHIKRATANHQVRSRLSFCSWFSRQRTVYLHDHHVSALSMLVSIFFHGFLGPTIPTSIIDDSKPWNLTFNPNSCCFPPRGLDHTFDTLAPHPFTARILLGKNWNHSNYWNKLNYLIPLDFMYWALWPWFSGSSSIFELNSCYLPPC